MTRRQRLLAAAAVPLLALGLAAPVHASSAPHGRVAVPGTHPAWALPSADLGPVRASTPVTVRVYLAGKDPAGLKAFARAVSDPRSDQYRHYLTPQQVRERFAPTPEQAKRVRGWLSSAGLTVSAETGHHLVAQGTAEQAQRAFGVELRSYQRDGHTYQAPVGEASVPAALASDVLSVSGLDTAPHQVHPGSAATDRAARPAPDRAAAQLDTLPGPSPAYVNSGPFSPYFGGAPAIGTPPAYGWVQPYVVQGYTGTQLREAYGATATGLTGKGVTIAVVDPYDSPTLDTDIATYAKAHGDAPYAAGQLVHNDPPEWTHTAEPGAWSAQDWYREQTMDVEAVHAVAPDADIQYVAASSAYGPDMIDALRRVVDGHLADLVSNSWGWVESDSDPTLNPVFEQVFQEGAVQGIGFYFATGDNGDELASSGKKQTQVPASLDFVTAVGGTSLGLYPNNGYAFETGWGTLKAPLSADGTSWTDFPGTFLRGAGGGTSTRTAMPSYQDGIVPDSLSGAHSGSNRVVPDIAAVADINTGFLVGQTQTFPNGETRYSESRMGGTSLATPVITALQALAQQAAGTPLGFANPAIYARYNTKAFHDITDHPFGTGTEIAEVRVDFVNKTDATDGTATWLDTLGHDSSLHAVEGYDDVTGVGTPTADYLRSYQTP
ncbi:protease pro-enzyme activation domain-containing protein [Streptomyces sp. NPDC096339]|uniref:S53 family peptidase n=1 Tax=Streptomyces sp. NPDC096339 TaxID=3366086 RepID=UPI00381152FA